MLIFFGTSPRSTKFLDLAVKNGLQVDSVVSAPPKPIGKKQILTENPTVTLAKNLKLPYLTSIFDLQPSDIGLILDFNQIIPGQIINLFSKGIINIHFSKLPQYKGPAPVQYTILNGDKQAWISYYLINEKVDAGQILKQTSLNLALTENTEDLYQKLIAQASQEAAAVIDDYLTGKLLPQAQSGLPSMTHKLTTENCKIDWSKTPEETERLIRASFPEPIAWTLLRPAKSAGFGGQAKRLKILKAHLENNQLIPDLVQLEGKKPVTWKQFQQGYPKAKISRD